MADVYSCPQCGTDVPDPPWSSGPVTIDRPSEGPTTMMHTACPQCGLRLVRYLQGDDPSWKPDPAYN